MRQPLHRHPVRFTAIGDVHRRTYVAMIGALDDEVGRVLGALDRKKIRDRTLVVLHSDNGGVTDAKTAGERPVAKAVASNGPYREGKGTIYEGGTHVVAIASWPGRIKAGGTVDALVHAVDLYPTFVGLAGGRADEGAKRLDGVDVWPAISQGEPSPRTEVVYNVEPATGGVRQGNWKLVWKAQLPASLELFDLASDPYEKKNLVTENPDKRRELQERINELAGTMAPPLFTKNGLTEVLQSPPAFPWYQRDAATTRTCGDHGASRPAGDPATVGPSR